MILMLLWLQPKLSFSQIDEESDNKPRKPTTQAFTLGLRFGPTVTFGHVNSLAEKGRFGSLPKAGFSISPQLTMPVGNRYKFITELGFLHAGRKMKVNSNDWVNSFSYNFLTTSMALRKTISVNFAEHLRGDIFISVGPNLAYLVNGKGKIIINAPPPKGPGTWNGASPDTSNWRNASWVGARFDIKYNNYDSAQWGDFNHYYINHPNRFLFGLDIGIGADAPINRNQNIFFEIRYTWGHTNLGNKQTQANLNILNFEDTQFVNLQTISFNLIYTFDFDTRGFKKGRSTENKRRQPVRLKK